MVNTLTLMYRFIVQKTIFFWRSIYGVNALMKNGYTAAIHAQDRITFQ
jgi:hypothetical protein